MRWYAAMIVWLVALTWSAGAGAQVQFMGKVWIPRVPEDASKMLPNTGIIEDYFAGNPPAGGPDMYPLTNIRCFATPDGPNRESMSSTTWSTAPAGWYRMMGSAGRYTLLFTGPAAFIRPTLFTNVFMRDRESVDRKVVPAFDYAVLHEGKWDDKPATDYYQTFIAKGKSVTQVGFKLASDGVDGFGMGSQTLVLSVHRETEGTPEKWEQVGPAMPVLNVDSGGMKNYEWMAGWNSGEVPLTPGKRYAIHLKAEKSGGVCQAFWRPSDDKESDCYRLGPKGATGFVGRQLCMAVATDSDGLVIPYNKRIQKEFLSFAGFAHKWSQTYVAQGRSLASAIMYTATSGVQPGIQRQRAVVRVRQGGPDGPVVGVEKIAIGNGIFTGDAAWGVLAAAFSPGEVPLEPSKTYALEMESIENYESLHGYVNIKKMPSDDKPGFNPYRKSPPDAYEQGTAYKNGTEDVGFDLDMQIIEYEHAPKDWDKAVEPKNLLTNGDMEAGNLIADDPDKSTCDGWKTFTTDPGTTFQYLTEAPANKYRFLRLIGGNVTGKPVDGGYFQKVQGLSHLDTYRLEGRVRSSWAVDVDHACWVGYDPTGQDADPKAATIIWQPMPTVHSIWCTYLSEPIRPDKNAAISVWLRGWTKDAKGFPFKADFDDFMLRRVRTEVPRPASDK